MDPRIYKGWLYYVKTIEEEIPAPGADINQLWRQKLTEDGNLADEEAQMVIEKCPSEQGYRFIDVNIIYVKTVEGARQSESVNKVKLDGSDDQVITEAYDSINDASLHLAGDKIVYLSGGIITFDIDGQNLKQYTENSERIICANSKSIFFHKSPNVTTEEDMAIIDESDDPNIADKIVDEVWKIDLESEKVESFIPGEYGAYGSAFEDIYTFLQGSDDGEEATVYALDYKKGIDDKKVLMSF